MDEARFDDIAKALSAQTTRRLTFRALLGGMLGVLGFAEAGETRSGACKPDCDECNTCKKGKCTKKNGKKRCEKGKCERKADGAACTIPTSGSCQNGVCTCLGGSVLTNGQCLTPCPLGQQRDPASSVCCIPNGAGPCKAGVDRTCCSGFCAPFLTCIAPAPS